MTAERCTTMSKKSANAVCTGPGEAIQRPSSENVYVIQRPQDHKCKKAEQYHYVAPNVY